MNKLYLIRKTEIDLINNRDNFNIIIKYLKSKYPLKRKELIEIENIGIKKYKEAYLNILDLVSIEQKINQLDSHFNNYHDDMLKLVFFIIILFLVSIFFLKTLFNYFITMQISSLWKISSIILVGGVNLHLALKNYNDIRYKNKSFNKYKNDRNTLNNNFDMKYEKVLEKIGWFELQCDSLLKESENDINNQQTKLENITEIKKILPEETNESNNKTFIKKYKKR